MGLLTYMHLQIFFKGRELSNIQIVICFHLKETLVMCYYLKWNNSCDMLLHSAI